MSSCSVCFIFRKTQPLSYSSRTSRVLQMKKNHLFGLWMRYTLPVTGFHVTVRVFVVGGHGHKPELETPCSPWAGHIAFMDSNLAGCSAFGSANSMFMNSIPLLLFPKSRRRATGLLATALRRFQSNLSVTCSHVMLKQASNFGLSRICGPLLTPSWLQGWSSQSSVRRTRSRVIYDAGRMIIESLL